MDINNKLLWLYRNIGDKEDDVLNYDQNKPQTDFGNNLRDLLILITRNCVNKITFIFNNINNVRSTLSIIGCSESNFIYEFYINLNDNIKKKNHNERISKLSQLLISLTKNISPRDSIYYNEIISNELSKELSKLYDYAKELSKLYDYEKSTQIIFPKTHSTYGNFFQINNLFDFHKKYRYRDDKPLLEENLIKFVLTGRPNNTVSLRTDNCKIYYFDKIPNDIDLNSQFLQDTTISQMMNRIAIETKISSHIGIQTYDRITSLKIEYKDNVIMEAKAKESRGGRKASVKKEIYGRIRCIYKIPGSRKEHIKHKGRLITVTDYKKLMKV